ncbi:MAG: RNA polymerase sigma factor RpoD/SigA [Fibrobacteria bacterium]|nr:RNA polymerase sigma factor RpoD/SigA [Fibrobacteria bacterium]
MHSDIRDYVDEHSIYQKYIKEVLKYPRLTNEEEKQLLKFVKQGDEAAFNKLICANLRFVIKVAFMYKGQGLPITDLINEGNIGLIEAAKRFDADKKVKFTSYAVWWIRQSITQALFEKARMVRLSAANELKIRRIGKHNQDTRQMVGGGGQSVDSGKLAESMGVTKHHMDDLLKMNQRHVSLDAPCCTASDTSYVDSLSDNRTDYPDAEVMKNSLSEFISNSMLHLSKKERKVLQLCFGLNQIKRLNLREVGELLGLSKERIRQIKEGALEKMRDVKMPRDFLVAA